MKAIQAVAALSLLLAASLAFAEDRVTDDSAEEDTRRWYQVEVLIFENPDYRAERPEQWPTYPTLQRRSPAITVAPEEAAAAEAGEGELVEAPPIAAEEEAQSGDTLPPLPFEPLPEAEHHLADARAQLERTRGFRILHHQAWRQPVPGRDGVVPIRVQAGETFGQNRELQGYLDLYVERYLHLTADLQLVRYTQTDNPFRLIDERNDPYSDLGERIDSFGGLTLRGESEGIANAFVSQSENRYYVAVESIRLNEKRRMRSGEIHYLDNPEFGLLFLVTPIELDATADEERG